MSLETLTERQRILRIEALLVRLFDALPLIVRVSLPKDVLLTVEIMKKEIEGRVHEEL